MYDSITKGYWAICSGKKERKGTLDGKNVMDKDVMIQKKTRPETK